MKRIWTTLLNFAIILGMMPALTGTADAAVTVIEPDYSSLINLGTYTTVIDANGNVLQWGGAYQGFTAVGSPEARTIMTGAEKFVRNDGYRLYVLKKDSSLWEIEGTKVKKLLDSFKSVRGWLAIDAKDTLWDVSGDAPVRIMDDVKTADGMYIVKNDSSFWKVDNENKVTKLWDSGAKDVHFEGMGLVLKEDNSLCLLDADGNEEKLLDDVKTFDAEVAYLAALKNDETVWTYGSNLAGVLGNGMTSWDAKFYGPQKVLDDVKEFAVRRNRTFALKNDNTLWRWGDFSGNYAYSPIKCLDNVASFFVSDIFLIAGAVTTDGSLYTWGYGRDYFLGTGSEDDVWEPTKVLSNVAGAYISIGKEQRTAAAVKTDGSLWMWGEDIFSQCGIPDKTYKVMKSAGAAYQTIPQQVPNVKMAVKQTIVTKGVPSMSNFTAKNPYNDGLFTDVPTDSWYRGNVKTAYEFGIMGGKGESKFDPNGNITVAEAIKMACVVHDTYYDTGAAFVQGSPWYQVYVDYAVAEGIIKAGDFSNFTAPATRAQMAYIFAHALPSEELQAINNGVVVPDVNETDAYGTEIYRLYRAGVLTGSDEMKSYRPTSNISRLEAATIITRIADASRRVSF